MPLLKSNVLDFLFKLILGQVSDFQLTASLDIVSSRAGTVLDPFSLASNIQLPVQQKNHQPTHGVGNQSGGRQKFLIFALQVHKYFDPKNSN